MKKFMLPLILLALTVSCSSGPETSAKIFAESIAKGDIDTAKKYATEKTGALLDFGKSLGGVDVNEDFEFKMLRDSIVGDKAWVFYTNEDGKDDQIQLMKKDGKWLVAIEANK